jgi:hypothetical protein
MFVAPLVQPAPTLTGTDAKSQPRPVGFCNRGGAEEDRTLDLRIANATLSQLSYRPSPAILWRVFGLYNCISGECWIGRKHGLESVDVNSFPPL